MFSSLIQWVAISLALLWLLAVVASFLAMFLSMIWMVLASPGSQPSDKGLAEKWMTNLDDLGEVLVGERLKRARKVLSASACIFFSLLLIGAAFALLKSLAG